MGSAATKQLNWDLTCIHLDKGFKVLHPLLGKAFSFELQEKDEEELEPSSHEELALFSLEQSRAELPQDRGSEKATGP